MSLPENPNTTREKYYSVIAGQNTVDILPDIETAPSTENRYLDHIARNGGGGGGGAVSSVNGKTGAVVLNASDVGALPNTTSIPTRTSDLTNDSNFVEDANYTHTDNNYTTADKTKLAETEPLIFFGTLAEWNALTDAEKAKYRTLKIPDTRVSDIEALIPSTATSSNKLATASDVAAKQSQITQSSLLTLTVAGWDSTTLQQTVTFAHDTTKWNVIDITLGEVQVWADCGVIAISETAAGITFQCDTVPDTALTFKVTSMEVN